MTSIYKAKIVPCRHMEKLVTLPTGVECQLVWARKIFDDSNIYELSLERLDGGFTMWYAAIVDGIFSMISNALTLTRETLLIKIEEEKRNQDYEKQICGG